MKKSTCEILIVKNVIFLLIYIFFLTGTTSLCAISSINNLHLSSEEEFDSLYIHVSSGWNLISVPLLVPDPRIATLFPSAISPAFTFHGTYTQRDSLTYGESVWLKFPQTDSVLIVGINPIIQAVSLKNRWNMIPSFAEAISLTTLNYFPDSTTNSGFFAYSPEVGYQLADTLIPGRGYWLRPNVESAMSPGTWEFLGFETETVTTIKVHPADSNIIFSGTRFDFSAGINGKLFRSTNGGDTWDTVLIGGSYLDIIFNPLHPDTMYTIPYSLYKSTDGGNSWNESADNIYIDPETRLQCLAIDPSNPSILYAGTGGFFGGTLYKSTNAGLSWEDLGVNNDTLENGVISLAIDPTNTNIVYAGTATLGFLLKSTDGGNSWLTTSLGETGLLVQMIELDPENSNIVYAGIDFLGLMVSTDAGVTWIKEIFSDNADGFLDMEFYISGDSSKLIASSLGVYISSCRGCEWVNLNQGLRHKFTNVLAVSGKSIYLGISTQLEKNGGVFKWKP